MRGFRRNNSKYFRYYPTSSSESEGEDEVCYVPDPVERPTTSTSHYTLNTFNAAPSSTRSESHGSRLI